MAKIKLFKSILVLSLVFTWSLVHAERDKETTKNYNKSFVVKDNVQLLLDVNFSDVNIVTWDQAQVDVDITITSQANSDDRAAEIIERIEVSIQGSESQVKVTTDLDNTNCKNNEQFDIHVNIKMPRNGSLHAKCNFGDLSLGDLNGPCKAHIQYATFNVSNLNSNQNNVKVSFGDLNAQVYGGGEVSAEYGSLEINRLSGDCKVTSSFGDVDIDAVDPNCKNLGVDMQYGSAEIKLPTGASYEIRAKSDFGQINFPSPVKKTTSEKGYTSEEYIGTMGSNPQGTISVRTQFGDVDFE